MDLITTAKRLSAHLVLSAAGILRRKPAVHALVKKHLVGTSLHRLVRWASSRNSNPFSGRLVADGSAGNCEGQRACTGHWDRNVARVESRALKGWLDWEFIEVEHIRPQVSGDRGVYYLQYFFSRHLPTMPVGRALSLGCGGGNLERALIHLKAAEHIDAYDVSPESIRLAKELADREGVGSRISYKCEDINKIALERGVYDFAIAKMSLHHFEGLEHVYDQLRGALKPGGVFVFNEFVGPSRFQWTDLQLEHANRLLDLLPEKNRWSDCLCARLEKITRPTIEEMIGMDPTEAVRSADIVSALGGYFEILEKKDYGGTILHLLLNHVMASFDLNEESQIALLRFIFLYETTLIEQGVLQSDFSYVVAKPIQAAGSRDKAPPASGSERL